MMSEIPLLHLTPGKGEHLFWCFSFVFYVERLEQTLFRISEREGLPRRLESWGGEQDLAWGYPGLSFPLAEDDLGQRMGVPGTEVKQSGKCKSSLQ